MSEDEAIAWVASRYSPEAVERLHVLVALLRAEADRQSLIARSTMDSIWPRHIVDSAQLLGLAPNGSSWLDIGSGGGLPGLVLAILSPATITLAEPRKLRAAFLISAAAELSLSNVTVINAKVQTLEGVFDVVTARAVAPIEQLFAWTTHLVSRETLYILPRGQFGREELANARGTWHGAFHVEQSITQPNSGIVVASNVRQR